MLTEDGRLFYLTKYKVTLDGSGDGTKTIVFEAPFTGTPQTKVISHKGDSGSWTTISVTNSGCTITATSSDILSQDCDVYLFVMEQL